MADYLLEKTGDRDADAFIQRWPASSRQRFALVKWSLCRLML
jgi:hypothetical protein